MTGADGALEAEADGLEETAAPSQPVAAVAVPSLVDEPGHGEHVAASEIVEPAGP